MKDNLFFMNLYNKSYFEAARRMKKRSLLGVNEHFSDKADAKRALLDRFSFIVGFGTENKFSISASYYFYYNLLQLVLGSKLHKTELITGTLLGEEGIDASGYGTQLTLCIK